jgi:hypothetical protein
MLLISLSYAQHNTIPVNSLSGIVKGTEKAQPLEYASIQILKTTDSSVIGSAVTDAEGKFSISTLPAGEYIIKATMVGYSPYIQHVSLTGNNPPLTINLTLKLKSATLKEIVVVSQKNLIQKEMGKIILNVAGNLQTNGSTAIEILQLAPGVITDRESEIKLNGKSNVMILIDGKQTTFSAEDAARALKNLSADNISRIEIISNPSAKYDAGYNAGVINIITKKNPKEGLTGTAYTSFGKGQYANKLRNGMNFNFNRKRTTVYGNCEWYNYDTRKTFNSWQLWNSSGNALTNSTDTKDRANQLNYSMGVDIKTDSNSVLGLLVTGALSKQHIDKTGNLILNKPNIATGDITNLDQISTSKNTDFSVNANYKTTFKKPGNTLNVDVNYVNTHQTTASQFFQDYLNKDGSVNSSVDIRNNIIPLSRLFSAKVDYTIPASLQWSLETGVKYTQSHIDNSTLFDTLENNTIRPDFNRTSYIDYKEDILAEYVNATKSFKKLSIQAGLRAEQAINRGNDAQGRELFNNKYIQLFPSLTVQYQANKQSNLSLSASKKVARPYYQNLNPFVQYVDQYTYFQGNPHLKPADNYVVELSHAWKGKYISTLGYNLMNRVIIQTYEVQQFDSQVTKITYNNLGVVHAFYMVLYVPVTITKWWSLNLNNISYFLKYANYDHLVYTDVNNGSLSFYCNMYNGFRLGSKTSANIVANYCSAQRINQHYLNGYVAMDASISQQVLQNRGTISLQGVDLFNSHTTSGTTRYFDVTNRFTQRLNIRTVRLTFRYRFGKTSVAAHKDRKLGIEEDKARIKLAHEKEGSYH